MTEMTIKQDDILLGRGPLCYRNPGNIKFRNITQSHAAKYVIDAPRSYKNKIGQSLINTTKGQGMRFLIRSKEDSNWYEAKPDLVQSKVGHALRDARNMSQMSMNDMKKLCLSKQNTGNLHANQSQKSNTRKFALSDTSTRHNSEKIPTVTHTPSIEIGSRNVSPVMDSHIPKPSDNFMSFDATVDSIKHNPFFYNAYYQ
jgi:hypothetical protein